MRAPTMTDACLSMDTAVAARAIIERAIITHPRGLKVEAGPSEWYECLRRFAYKLGDTPPARVREPAWRPTVGTAVHAWLADAFVAENVSLGWDRWLIETPLTIGEIAPGRLITGSCDLFDRLTGTVLDWKIPGPSSIKKYRSRRDPGYQYRTQINLYGLGWLNAGHTVNTVSIYFLPSAGELGDGYYWTEPFDLAVAATALARAQKTIKAADAVGWDTVITLSEPVADNCTYCPWWKPESADLRTGCPGVLPQRRSTTDPRALFGRVESREASA